MKVTINDKCGNPLYVLRTFSNGLCWEIFEWKTPIPATRGRYTGVIRGEGFKTMMIYPNSLQHGLCILSERGIRNSQAEVNLSDCASEIQRILDDWVIEYGKF